MERTDKELAHLIKLLEDSLKEYLSFVENVSEAQWNWKPGPGRWSVGETAEHILLAEGRLFSAMERAAAAPQNPDWEKSTAGKTELLERSICQGQCLHDLENRKNSKKIGMTVRGYR